MGFVYTEFQPRPDSRHIVDAYWMNHSELIITPSPTADRVLPDGCIDLVFHRAAHGATRLFVSPLIEEPTLIDASTSEWFVGVRFRPGMSRVVLDVAPEECRNCEHAATNVDREFAFLEDQLSACVSPEEALHALHRSVDLRLHHNLHRAAPVRVRRALSLLTTTDLDTGGVAAVAGSLGVTTRTLHREILRWTGHSPKVLARILRMQTAMQSLRTERSPLAEVSVTAGYADQAHMTREFRRLTGATPRAFLRPA